MPDIIPEEQTGTDHTVEIVPGWTPSSGCELFGTNGTPANIVGVTAGSSAVAVSFDTVLDVDGCSDILSLSKRLPSDSTGTSTGGRLTSDVEGNRVTPTPKCVGVLTCGSSTISSIAIRPGGRGRPSGP